MGSSYIKSLGWLRYKNTTINPKNIDDRSFVGFAFTQSYKETKSHTERVSNMKPFFDLCNSKGTEYPKIKDKNNYALLEKNPKVILIVLHIELYTFANKLIK